MNNAELNQVKQSISFFDSALCAALDSVFEAIQFHLTTRDRLVAVKPAVDAYFVLRKAIIGLDLTGVPNLEATGRAAVSAIISVLPHSTGQDVVAAYQQLFLDIPPALKD